jgi:hypothetical protein
MHHLLQCLGLRRERVSRPSLAERSLSTSAHCILCLCLLIRHQRAMACLTLPPPINPLPQREAPLLA